MDVHSHMEAVKKEITALEKTPVSSPDYRAILIEILRNAVPFDAACCTTVDPRTLLSTGAVTENSVEKIHHLLFENEYLYDDFNKYANLAKAEDPTATLSGATHGQLKQSSRYRNILRPAGFRDEMRAALVYEGLCWGYLTLFRNRNQPVFQEAERTFVSSLVPSISYVLRKRSLELPTKESEWMQKEPGILVLSDRLASISSDAAADCWLSLLRKWEQIDSITLPRPVRAVCSHAKSEKAPYPEQASMSKVCLRTPDGQFLVIRASRLSGASDSKLLAVCFESAKPLDMLPFMTEAYGLSLREKQILDEVLKGFSTKEIALSLHISAYTVQDHMKSIFMKTGVTSRRELIWNLFARFSLLRRTI